MTDWLTLAISGWHRCLHPCARTPTAFATIMWSRETGVALPLPSGDGWNSSPRSCWGRRSVPMTTTLSATSCEGSATSWPDWADKMSTRPSFCRLQLFLPCLWPWVTLSHFVRPRMCLSLSYLSQRLWLNMQIELFRRNLRSVPPVHRQSCQFKTIRFLDRKGV